MSRRVVSRRAATAATCAVAAVALAGCTFKTLSDLDDIEQELWVDVTARPSNFDPFEYGLGVAAARRSTGLGIGVVGQVVNGVTHIAYDESGALASHTGVPFPNAAPAAGVLPIAGDPAGSTIVFGLNENGPRYAVIDAEDGTQKRQTVGFDLTVVGMDAAPSALVISALEAGGESRLVATVGQHLFVFEDYDGGNPTPEICSLGSEAASLLVPDPEAGEILIALAERLVSLAAADIPARDGSSPPEACPVTVLREQPGVTAMAAIGDLVAIGFAGEVRVFRDGDFDAPETVSAPGGSAQFGGSLAAGRLSGADHLVVGDSGATVDGRANAGMVHIYGVGSLSAPVASLHDFRPDANQRFGRSVAVAEFSSGSQVTPLLVVAGGDEVYTYFRLRASDPDPRAGR